MKWALDLNTRNPDRSESQSGIPSFPDVCRVSNRISDTLSSVIDRRDIGEIVKFSAPSRLLSWADEQMSDSFLFDKNVPAKEASQVLTENLTERGIETFTNNSMGVAVLLTELLASDERFGRNPEVIREAISEHGYGLVTSIMTSEDLFNRTSHVKKELLTLPRSDVFRRSTYDISYRQKDDKVTQLRWKIKYQKRTSAGCPFALAEHGKAVKKAWKVVVDMMWDELLEWRVETPLAA